MTAIAEIYPGLSKEKKAVVTQELREQLRPLAPQIQRIVAEFYRIEEWQLKSPARQRNITNPRQIAMYLIQKHAKCSLKTIGARFNRDHTTVISSIKTVNGLIDTDRFYKLRIEQMEKLINDLK